MRMEHPGEVFHSGGNSLYVQEVVAEYHLVYVLQDIYNLQPRI